MTSDAFAKYKNSVRNYGYEQYHDGASYDLEALRQVLPNEAEQVIDQMELSESPNWIEVEVLDTIGTDRCLKILTSWSKTKEVTCRMCSLSALHKRKRVDDAYAEEIILTALSETTILNGMTHVLQWVKMLRTTRIKRQVLWCALHGHSDIRAHCAGLAHFLYGVTKESFDWSRRPFYLQFNELKTAEIAYRQLCTDVQDVGCDSGQKPQKAPSHYQKILVESHQ